MSINIQEVFYPSDSDQIKWEKVNYNFDQILSTGGKEGPRGERGPVGATGIGEKGDTGEKGEKGDKGDTGSSTNVWDQFDHANTAISAFVIKPKDTGKIRETAVVIGDNSYTEGVDTGITDVNAQLTVLQDDQFLFAQKWHPSGGTNNITIRGEQATVGINTNGTKWILMPEGMGTNTRVEIRSEELTFAAGAGKIILDATGGIDLTGTGTISVQQNVEINNDTIINGISTLNGNTSISGTLSTNGNVTFSGTTFLKIPTGTTVQRPTTPNDGMIRFNSSTSKFEGYSTLAATWLDLTRLSNSTKTTFVSVEADTQYNSSENNKVVVRANNSLHATFNDSYTAGLDSVVEGSRFWKDLILQNNIYVGAINRGIIFRPGVAGGSTTSDAPNFGSLTINRKFDDYFVSNYIPTSPLKHGTTAITTTQYNNTTSEFNVSYVKTGALISVNGRYKVYPSVGLWTIANLTGQLTIDLGDSTEFPYVNDTGKPILVTIKVLQGKYTGNPDLGTEDLPMEIYGIIENDASDIKIYHTNYSGTATTTEVWLPEEVIAGRLYGSTGDGGFFELLFNFQMFTEVKAYQAQGTSGGLGVG